MKTKLLLAILSFILALLFYSCESGTEPTNDNNLTTTHFTLKLSLAEVQTEVDSIVGILERTGFTSIEKIFTISGDSATADFGDIVFGTWHLSVSAFDSIGTKIYFGETDVTITAGQITVVNLTLDPLTGGLVVNVKWGTGGSGEYIYFVVDNTFGIREVYRYNLQTSLVEKITSSTYIKYLTFISIADKIGFTPYNSNEFWTMNLDGSNSCLKFTNSIAMIRPIFCPINQKIYYHNNDANSRIAVSNYDGTNQMYFTPENLYNDSSIDIDKLAENILFTSDSSGVFNIHRLHLSNLKRSQLTHHTSEASDPKWANTKNGFYYLLNINENVHHINFYDLNTNISQTILQVDSLYILYFDNSIQDDKIVYVTAKSSTQLVPSKLFIYDITSNIIEKKILFNNVKLGNPHWIEVN